ncbi:MAG: redoxin domain-containing protein [Phycisphaerae bacterium]|nr:redoxin domain-containing protein [Phycisphaerae bacterium]
MENQPMIRLSRPFTWPKTFIITGLLVGLLLSVFCLVRQIAPARGQINLAVGHPQAPDFPADFTWINTPVPLSFQHQLKGQVVLLDFWTYGCINCIHILPGLDFLQHHFAGQPFIIIGVHSAKFTNESTVNNIRQAVLRYRIDHPVIVDEHMRIWNDYGVDSWPTLVLVSASGHIVGSVDGEGNRRVLEKAIAKTLQRDKANGTLAAAPLQLPREHAMLTASGLLFPGKVLADPRSRRLFIADTDHNRIVIAGWPNAMGHTRLIAVIGNGLAGAVNGPAHQAEFRQPQGLALDGNTLYVADTNNHLIRAVNLHTLRVSTILGTGRETFDFTGGGVGTTQGINSPWALAARGHTLYIAMAGEHQIWKMNLQTRQAHAFAGTGAEGLVNGSCAAAELAQPSGLCLHRNHLYFADSENSAIRVINLQTRRVSTLVGRGLFTFGDRDGPARQALLQHPLGLALLGRRLLVADTYNHKLRTINLHTRIVGTFLGTGRPGTGTPGGPLEFYEPGGLSVADGWIFVADTDNQRILMINAKTKSWHELAIMGLTAPRSHRPQQEVRTTGAIGQRAVTLTASSAIALRIDLKLPPQTHLTPGIPVTLRVTDGSHILIQQSVDPKGHARISFVFRPMPDQIKLLAGSWHVGVFYAYCTDGHGSVCKPSHLRWVVPVTLSPHGAHVLLLHP